MQRLPGLDRGGGGVLETDRVRVQHVFGPLINLRIAVSSRRKTRNGEYADTPPMFYEVTVWDGWHENTAASLHSGDRVLVCGATRTETRRGDGLRRAPLPSTWQS